MQYLLVKTARAAAGQSILALSKAKSLKTKMKLRLVWDPDHYVCNSSAAEAHLLRETVLSLFLALIRFR